MSERLYFEDFRPGRAFSFGDRVIGQAEIIAFAREFDPQPQHTDPVAAKDGMLGGLVASGWHLCALAMRMIADGILTHAASLGAPGVDEVQWRRPVRPGDTLRMTAEVLDARASASRPNLGFVRFRFEMLRGQERVMFFVSTAMFERRSD